MEQNALTPESQEKNKSTRRNGGGCLILFGLIFFAAAFGFTWFSFYPYISGLMSAQDWPSVKGQLQHSDLEHVRGDDSTTYKTIAKYSYLVEGKRYEGDRVSFQRGSDSFYDYHAEFELKLRNDQAYNGGVTVFYDPKAPYDSVLDRTWRWDYIALHVGFVLLFGGVGIGVMIAGSYVQKRPVQDPTKSSATISSSTLGKRWGLFLFFSIFLGFSAFGFVLIPQELEKNNYWILLFLIIPGIGLLLLQAWWTAFREHLRFGEITLELEPTAGQVGGDLSGSIQLKEPYNPEHRYLVSIACVKHLNSNHKSSNDDTSQNILWQEEGICLAESSPFGTLLRFAFDIPQNLPASQESTDTEDRVEWHLAISAKLPGPDLSRSFVVPVQKLTTPLRMRRTIPYSNTLFPESEYPKRIVRMEKSPDYTRLTFPASRNANLGCGFLIIGVFFAGIGGGVGYAFLSDILDGGVNAFSLFFALIPVMIFSVFLLIGLFMLLVALRSLFNSRILTFDHSSVVSIRDSFLVFGSTRNLEIQDIQTVILKPQFTSTSGNHHGILAYQLEAETGARKPLLLADGIQGKQLARSIGKSLIDELSKRGSKAQLVETAAELNRIKQFRKNQKQ
jgi:hypothetical protein